MSNINFTQNIRNRDYEMISSDLRRIVLRHYLIRRNFAGENGFFADNLLIEDIVQELFLSLWKKNRFAHYIHSGMTDEEITRQISRIELGNLLTEKIRKSAPETFRLLKRISNLLQASKSFRRFEVETSGAMKKRFYGLSFWTNKPERRADQMAAAVKNIPVCRRDYHLIGCTGDVEIIIGNRELEELMCRVFSAIDGFCELKPFRKLVLSKLPVQDISIIPIAIYTDDEIRDEKQIDFLDGEPNPEQKYLKSEKLKYIGENVDGFLSRLLAHIKYESSRQTSKILKILYYCYLQNNDLNQLQAAALIGCSDSSVSFHRRRIEDELVLLKLPDVETAEAFSRCLYRKVSERLFWESGDLLPAPAITCRRRDVQYEG